MARETETKEERFKRVAAKRTGKAVKAIKSIGDCAGLRYSYTVEQTKEICEALREAITDIENKFTNHDVKDQISFSFKE